MYAALGKTVKWKDDLYTVQGMSPAKKVCAGIGMAAMLIVEGCSVYINTKELKVVE